MGIQLLRGFLLFASSSLYFNGLIHLPLATAATISICSPLLITALSVPFLGEAVGPRRWAAVAAGFIGALIVIRPGMEGTNPYVLFIVASMTCGTFYALLTRKYSGEENAEVSEFRERLEHAIAQLSEDHRAVFLLYSEEQLRYEEPTRRSDLFSLGVVLFELLSGERLYRNTEGSDGTRRSHRWPDRW